MIEVPPRLTALFTADAVHAHLLPHGAWKPYPTSRERDGWQALPEETRAELIANAEERTGAAWPELPATLYMEFKRNGNRSRYEERYSARRTMLIDLVLGECAAGDGRFLDDVANGVWAICEESSWCLPAHANHRHTPPLPLPDTAFPVVDLFAAETGALLAWTWYLLRDARTDDTAPVFVRIEREVQRRILIPYRTIDEWWWLGKERTRHVNNWNPWIHANILTATLLLERDQETRAATVLRAIEGVDVFLAAYHADGGCDEGVNYWGRAAASLFDCLDLLCSASGGTLDGFALPLVREMGRYVMRMHIGGPWYVNFADGAALAAPEADLVFRYGQRIGDVGLMAQGAYAASFVHAEARHTAIGRRLPALFNAATLAAADATPPLVRAAWLPGIQVLVARARAGSADGLFLAAKGGHNDESHNHNDIGSCIVALDGVPVVIDVGVETYTRETFSDARYTIWTMQSGYHNLPVIDGNEQLPGRAYAARDAAATITDDAAALTLDIAPAYPHDAGIIHWRRTLRLERGGAARVVIADDYALDHAPASLASHLMLAGPVDTETPGVLRVRTATRPLRIHYDAKAFAARVEEIAIDDARLSPVWGARIFRVILDATVLAARGQWMMTMEPDS